MGLPPLPLPVDERQTALDGLLAILQRDPWLKTAGTTWSTWQGDPSNDGQPFAEATLPAVIATARPAPSGWYGSGFHRSDMFVDLQIGIDGTNQRDGMKFWRAIERAILPTDNSRIATIAEQLGAVGISGVEIVQPGWGLDPANAEHGIQVCKGTIKLTMYILTPGHAT